ncbi:MAG: hypothetical protein JWR26_4699 [Pedosphaera sp.]|nr:hypothetical protein [Pedosphaera sp.]
MQDPFPKLLLNDCLGITCGFHLCSARILCVMIIVKLYNHLNLKRYLVRR